MGWVVLGLGLSVCLFVVCDWVRSFFSWWVPPFFWVSVLCVLGSFFACGVFVGVWLPPGWASSWVPCWFLPCVGVRRFFFVGFSYAFFFFSSCLRFCWSCFFCACFWCFAGVFLVACVSGSAASCVLGWRGSSCSSGLGSGFLFGSCVGRGVFCSFGLPCGVFSSPCGLCFGCRAPCPCSVWCGVPSWCSWLLVRWQVVLCRCCGLSWLLQPGSLRGGLGCGGLLSALLPASGFGVQRS